MQARKRDEKKSPGSPDMPHVWRNVPMIPGFDNSWSHSCDANYPLKRNLSVHDYARGIGTDIAMFHNNTMFTSRHAVQSRSSGVAKNNLLAWTPEPEGRKYGLRETAMLFYHQRHSLVSPSIHNQPQEEVEG
jgi:hypothetical protein